MKPELDPRFDDLLCYRGVNPANVLRGKYLQIALLDSTGPHVCALAARLSHESWSRSAPLADEDLLTRLEKSGDEHAKGLRWLQYCLLIDAPRYWWAEMDTYTVGIIPMGSTSTMHKEAKRLKGDDLVAAKAALPEGTRQLRIRGFSYHALKRIAAQRRKHRLPEWQEFCGFVDHLYSKNPLRWPWW